MLKAMFDSVMDRRANRLLQQIGAWLPRAGPLLDLGSGTGHLAAHLERELGVDVVTADVADIHVVGPAPVLIDDVDLPFDDDTFAAALLLFMLAYPADPAAVLREAARVTRGPVILVQSVYAGRFGYARHRAREFVWTIVAFQVSKLAGYIARHARFTMHTRRFYTAAELAQEVAAAGLRIGSRRERPVRPGRSLRVVMWSLVRDE